MHTAVGAIGASPGKRPSVTGVDMVRFEVNGRSVAVAADGSSLLEVLRDRLGLRAAKDGCSPQGQCGCCTVWVDGQPRVACVTPVTRVADRTVTTLEGLAGRERWGESFCAAGGSQCGFCTPGIIMRLASLTSPSSAETDQALLAHMCRCTGWQTIREACHAGTGPAPRDFIAASRRAEIEGGSRQVVSPYIALGEGHFADDTAPLDALVAVLGSDHRWYVGETLTHARALSDKRQGRRTTAPPRWPVDLPSGDWARTLQTTWVEPAYLEPDASWCAPGREPVTSLANGGAFGGKIDTDVGRVARRLADEHDRPVRVLYSREDVVRRGPKRPPLAIGLRRDGSGTVRVARCPGVAAVITDVAPQLGVEEVDVLGPPVSLAIRAAGWAEVAVALSSLRDADEIVAPNGARAHAKIVNGAIQATVRCGAPLDPIVLRSYCIGAAHQALGWVRSEALCVDADGEVHDLTVRSFGVVRAIDTPEIVIVIEADNGPPINGSDAVFVAVAAAVWRAGHHFAQWPLQAADNPAGGVVGFTK